MLTLPEGREFLRTVRSAPEVETWPMLFDARGATTNMTDREVDQAVAAVAQTQQTRTVPRGYVAIIADDDHTYERFLQYETRTAAAGIPGIRVFWQYPDAEGGSNC
jgi:hypothetical protein